MLTCCIIVSINLVKGKGKKMVCPNAPDKTIKSTYRGRNKVKKRLTIDSRTEEMHLL